MNKIDAYSARDPLMATGRHGKPIKDKGSVSEERMKKPLVLVIEGVPLFREGLRTILENTEECILVGAYANASLLPIYVQDTLPDVLILDADLSGVNLYDLFFQARLVIPKLALIVLTSSGNEETLFQFQVAGARAYTTKTIAPHDLLTLIGAVQRGDYLFSEEVIDEACIRQQRRQEAREVSMREEEARHASPFTLREQEILELLAQEHGIKEIATMLHMSAETVSRHLTEIQQKLAVEDRTAALIQAVRKGWVTLAPP